MKNLRHHSKIILDFYFLSNESVYMLLYIPVLLYYNVYLYVFIYSWMSNRKMMTMFRKNNPRDNVSFIDIAQAFDMQFHRICHPHCIHTMFDVVFTSVTNN